MLTKLKARLGGLGIGLLAAAVVAVGVVAVPATAQPVATASQGIVKQVRLALKYGQVANKRAVSAIRLARRNAQTAGQRGPVGPQGPRGLPGEDGSDGSDGSNGSNGSNGSDGSDGTDGADGKTVLNGFAAPNNTVGVDGDFYIDTNSQTIYGPKGDDTPGEWPTPGTDLKGADGTDGQPWTPENELPTGATLTGVYSPNEVLELGAPFPPLPGGLADGDHYLLPVAFPIALDAAPDFVFVPNVGASFGSNSGAGCPGVVGGVPQAASGKFCVYANTFNAGAGTLPIADVEAVKPIGAPSPGSTAVGAMLEVRADCGSPACSAAGLWAVTG